MPSLEQMLGASINAIECRPEAFAALKKFQELRRDPMSHEECLMWLEIYRMDERVSGEHPTLGDKEPMLFGTLDALKLWLANAKDEVLLPARDLIAAELKTRQAAATAAERERRDAHKAKLATLRKPRAPKKPKEPQG